MRAAKSRPVIERLARDDVRARATRDKRRELGLNEADVAAALASRHLRLQYQPIVDIRTGSCRRVEALLRWQHPRHGQILPGEFLHLASPSLLQAIDLWVINAALHQRLAWRAEGEHLGVCVNLTRHDIAQLGEIVSAVRGIERGAVTFEIRAADMSLGTDVQLAPVRLASTGAGVTLDDVTPDDAPTRAVAATIDEIKIARSLVMRAAGDPRAHSAVRSLVEFARDHRLGVVAVGVEDRATFDLVASLGCDMAQGYWVSRPLVPDRLRPARRWAAGLAFTGVLAFGTQVAASKVAASGGRAIELPLSQSGLFSSACCLDVAVASDAARLPVATKLEQVQARTGLPFTSSATARADLFVESSLGPSFTRTLTSKVAADIASLEQEFGRPLESRPSIYIFATRSNFALGLQQAFGVRGPDAGVLAAANGGIALTRQNAIVINLQNVNAKDLAVVRHELTHTMVHQIIGADGSIPTWLHEGIATTQERRGMDDELASARNASTALAVLSAGNATLEDLEPAEQWIQRNAALGGQAYTVSAEAVRLLEERVSHEGLLRILDSVGRGESFGAAFAAEASESLGDFEGSFPARLAADQGSARVVQVQHADGVRWSIAGFTPGKPVTISIDGAQYKLKFEVVADQNGMYEAVFGATAPKGEYLLRATSPVADATVTIRT